jgi:N-hydroxyarylamine O-acetyltransferase
MSEINFDRYLQRIGITYRPAPGLDALRYLQKQHMLQVPFENIDIYYGVPVGLRTEAAYTKIVTRRRGGYCYECNGLFHALLQWLGFNSRMISCRVATGKNIGAEFDHMALVVTIQEAEWLVDVGFGHFAAMPLLLEMDKVQQDGYADYCIHPYGVLDGRNYLAACRNKTARDEWAPIYLFTTESHPLEAFAAMHHYHQTAADSHFTKNLICSRLTESGRQSLVNNRLITTTELEKEDRLVYGHDALRDVLADTFDILNALPATRKIQ